MSKTQQGNFDPTYGHIEAPTVQDKAWWERHHQRRLTLDGWRTEELRFLADSEWVFSRKLDGQNMRIRWDGEQALWNGKTNNFTCDADWTGYMNETFLEELFEEKFGRETTVVLFGERMGPKIQGNELSLPAGSFVLFDVNVNDVWLQQESLVDIARFFGIKTPHDYMGDAQPHTTYTLKQLVELMAEGVFKGWEGVVAKPRVELKDRLGKRLICKIKNKDYLRLDK